jgi:hypothetical protein
VENPVNFIILSRRNWIINERSDITDSAEISTQVSTQARIAVYDDLLSSPRVVDVEPAPILEFIESITTITYELSHGQGGSLPYTVIREIVENFIHANFKECTVSILDGGNTLRFSDQGPGIEKKDLVLQPGVSSATANMKRFIKGVGSGFPVVREYLNHTHGFLSIDDNATMGTIITLEANDINAVSPQVEAAPVIHLNNDSDINGIDQPTSINTQISDIKQRQIISSFVPAQPEIRLQDREDQALLLLVEKGMLGSGELAGLLNISAPTATRLLQKLESLGMVETAQFKKRILSNAGLAYTQKLLGSAPAF